MKTWQKILNSKGESFSSTAIKTEIEKLEVAGQELVNCQPRLKRTMEKARQDLLSESVGASDRMKEAQGAISENENKKLGISGIIRNLNDALEKALLDEQNRRQSEIIRETAVIDEKMKESRVEMAGHFAKACVLFKDITGQEYYSLSSEHFENYGMTGHLRDLIAENSADNHRASLYQRRQTLSAEGIRLRK